MTAPTIYDVVSASSSNSAPRPSGTAIDDLLVFAAATLSPGSSTAGELQTLPANFSLIRRERGVSGFAPELLVGFKIIDANDPASFSFTTVLGSESNIVMIRIRDGEFDPADPINVVLGAVQGANGNNINVGTLSVDAINVLADALSVLFATHSSTNDVSVDGDMMDKYGEYNQPGSTGAISVFSKAIVSAGSFGAIGITGTSNTRMRAILFSVNAAAETPPDPDPGTEFTATDIEPTTRGYNLPFTTDGNGTVSAVAVIAGTSAPSATQIHEGKNAAGTVLPAGQRNSVSAQADTTSQIGLSGLDFPIYDVYLAVDEDVVAFTGQMTLPPAGYQHQVADLGGSALPAESVMDADTAGNGATGSDILEISLTVSPQGIGITPTETGGFELASAITGRCSFETRTYDYSAGVWHTETGLSAGQRKVWYINNNAPVEVTPIPAQQWFVGIPIEDIRLDQDHVSDPESDDLTYSVDPALPAGISIEIINDQDGPRAVITGTPEEESEDDYVITVTDEATDTVALTAVTITVVEGVEIPDVIGDTSGDAFDALNTLGLSVDNIIYDPGSEEEPGTVISISPAIGQIVPPGTQVYLTVAGYAYYALTPEPARNNTNSLIPPGTVANWALWMDGDVDSPRRGILPDHAKEGAVFDADSRMPFGSNSPGAGWLVIDDPHATDKSLSQIWSGPVVIGE